MANVTTLMVVCGWFAIGTILLRSDGARARMFGDVGRQLRARLTKLPRELPRVALDDDDDELPLPLLSRHSLNLRQFVHTKCGGRNRRAVWTYEGSLFDPFDGRRIAEVEGIEWVVHGADRYRYDDDDDESSSSSDLPLQCRELLRPTNANDTNTNTQQRTNHNRPSWTYAGTVWNRKLFVYRAPLTPSGDLLSEIHVRPDRKRPVSPREAVALYDTVTTYVSTVCQNTSGTVVHTEWPDGRSVLSAADEWDDDDDDDEEHTRMDTTTPPHFTVHSRGLSSSSSSSTSSSSSSQWPLHLPLTQRQRQRSTAVTPPRTRWIQFGPDKTSDRSYGTRETYRYEWASDGSGSGSGTSSPHFTVRYTRHGEGPPWYGVGRTCTLELRGQRRMVSPSEVEEELPTLAATLAKELVPVPGFARNDGEEENNANSQANANVNVNEDQWLQWFRNEAYDDADPKRCQAWISEEEASAFQNTNGWYRRAHHVLSVVRYLGLQFRGG